MQWHLCILFPSQKFYFSKDSILQKIQSIMLTKLGFVCLFVCLPLGWRQLVPAHLPQKTSTIQGATWSHGRHPGLRPLVREDLVDGCSVSICIRKWNVLILILILLLLLLLLLDLHFLLRVADPPLAGAKRWDQVNDDHPNDPTPWFLYV